MPVAYSKDLRDRVLAAVDRGMKTMRIVEIFAVSPSWVRRVKQRLREYGETGPRPPTPRAQRFKINRTRLVELVEAHSDATLKELREMLGVKCAESAIWMALDGLCLTYKVRRSTQPNRTARMSPAASGMETGPAPRRCATPDLVR